MFWGLKMLRIRHILAKKMLRICILTPKIEAMERIFKRKAYQQLLEWKENWASQYAIMVEGARRVGKSTLVEEFAKENYASYIKVDFSDTTPDLDKIFEDLSHLDLFFLRLQSYMGVDLVERKSCIIFDEIEYAPKVRQAIKRLVKDGRYDYIETGSLISIKKNTEGILLPSEEMKMQVYPLDYEEFCWATGAAYSNLEKLLSLNSPIGEATNRKLMCDFRLYMAIGGMPQAIEAYLNKRSFQQIDRVKREIISLYEDDFRKIEPSGSLSLIYEAIPAQLFAKKSRFFISKALGRRVGAKKEEMLSKLESSKTVLVCHSVADPSLSLSSSADPEDYKLYLSDTGLLVSLLFKDKSLVGEGIYSKLLSSKLEANLGFLYENALAQEIASSGRGLYFHHWCEEGKSHPREIDFLLTDGAKIIPIEVKSSDAKNHVSIDEFSTKYSRKVSRCVLFSQGDLSHDGMLELKPIYLANVFLKNLK